MAAVGNYETVIGTFDYLTWQVDQDIPAPTGKVILGFGTSSSFRCHINSDGTAMSVRYDNGPLSAVPYWMTVAEMGC